MTNPQWADTWLVDLNPTIGQEIRKTRPVVVVSANVFNPIALRIVIPVTTWQDKFAQRPFMVPLSANQTTGLNKQSAANVLQIRSLSTQRFSKKLGRISNETMQEILVGLAVCVDYVP
ncbi:MAG: type II toxin-antitoxin system PemK/MazF family toxin [Merismopedia sp. SIO2A8]|nr:type II toxin-antitoxin system PemK/MazF family toxin [Merismopedia sp. SIO2A8]